MRAFTELPMRMYSEDEPLNLYNEVSSLRDRMGFVKTKIQEMEDDPQLLHALCWIETVLFLLNEIAALVLKFYRPGE